MTAGVTKNEALRHIVWAAAESKSYIVAKYKLCPTHRNQLHTTKLWIKCMQ